MLVLTRVVGEKVRIGENIFVMVIEASRSKARLGFEAPDCVSIWRDEIRVTPKPKEENDLLKACKELLPFAEKAVEELNSRMVGNLYPSINLAMLERARVAIAKAEAQS